MFYFWCTTLRSKILCLLFFFSVIPFQGVVKIQVPISSMRLWSNHTIAILRTSQVTWVTCEGMGAQSVPGAYTMRFLIPLTTCHDLYNLRCEVYLWKVGVSLSDMTQYSRHAVRYRRLQASPLCCGHSSTVSEDAEHSSPISKWALSSA